MKITKTRGKKVGLVASGLALAGLATWNLWPASPLPTDARADLVVVLKATRHLDRYQHGVLLKSYSVSLGRHPEGPKRQLGDGRTPEGEYVLDYRNPGSSFYRAIHISYPAPADLASARAHGASPGGLVMVHGMKNGEFGGSIARAGRRLQGGGRSTPVCRANDNTKTDQEQLVDRVTAWTRVREREPMERTR